MERDLPDGGLGIDGRDVRFGHDLTRVQDESGVDLLLLEQLSALSVEERLLALEDFVRFSSEVRPA
jgi:hypothetical protein